MSKADILNWTRLCVAPVRTAVQPTVVTEVFVTHLFSTCFTIYGGKPPFYGGRINNGSV